MFSDTHGSNMAVQRRWTVGQAVQALSELARQAEAKGAEPMGVATGRFIGDPKGTTPPPLKKESIFQEDVRISAINRSS